MTKVDYHTIFYISKVNGCPYCNANLNFTGNSKISVRNSIEKLYESMNSHFDICKSKKNNHDKKIVSVSINTKKHSDKLYSSSFDTHSLMTT